MQLMRPVVFLHRIAGTTADGIRDFRPANTADEAVITSNVPTSVVEPDVEATDPKAESSATGSVLDSGDDSNKNERHTPTQGILTPPTIPTSPSPTTEIPVSAEKAKSLHPSEVMKPGNETPPAAE